jgi:hypothetical protein
VRMGCAGGHLSGRERRHKAFGPSANE